MVLGEDEMIFFSPRVMRFPWVCLLECFPCKSMRMSIRAPPSLLELAGQSLLRDQALAVSAMEELPRVLYLLLFMEAFSRRHFEALTVMVQAWPFTRLPLGSLMKTLHLETLKALLEGLHMVLTQKDRPR